MKSCKNNIHQTEQKNYKSPIFHFQNQFTILHMLYSITCHSYKFASIENANKLSELSKSMLFYQKLRKKNHGHCNENLEQSSQELYLRYPDSEDIFFFSCVILVFSFVLREHTLTFHFRLVSLSQWNLK